MHRRDLTAASYDCVLGANERVSLGFIGVGNRGNQALDAFLEHGDSEINALCDIRQDYLPLRAHLEPRQAYALPELSEAPRSE
jgi:hypothetical protein